LNDSPDVATNIVIATTKWRLVSIDEGQEREEELRRKYWNDLFDKGAKYGRFKEDTDSAWDIVGLVPLDRQVIPRVIREELEKFRPGLKTQAEKKGLLSLLKSFFGCA
jgi:hypothetical protein